MMVSCGAGEWQWFARTWDAGTWVTLGIAALVIGAWLVMDLLRWRKRLCGNSECTGGWSVIGGQHQMCARRRGHDGVHRSSLGVEWNGGSDGEA